MKYSLSNDTWGKEELAAAEGVLRSGLFTMGENVKAFERQFAQYFGVKYAVMSNSGSSANLLAIAALVYSGRLRGGDEVLVPAVSWSTTYFPPVQMGLKIRLVDIDIYTLNIDISKLEAALTEKTKAIFAVNLLGNASDFSALRDFCARKGLLLLEDNCEAMGAVYDGKKTGSFGLLGTFSTFYSHHICTMEGGVTVTDDEELYHTMLAVRAHGWTRQLPKDSPIYKKEGDSFYESFNFIMPGFNLRPLEIEAAVGVQQLKKLPGFIETRRENAKYFLDKFSLQNVFILQRETGESSWFGFSLIIARESEIRRDDCVQKLRAAEIEVRPIVAGNFARQKAFGYIDASVSGALTNAEYLHENGFFVGNHSIPMEEKIDYLYEVLFK